MRPRRRRRRDDRRPAPVAGDGPDAELAAVPGRPVRPDVPHLPATAPRSATDRGRRRPSYPNRRKPDDRDHSPALVPVAIGVAVSPAPIIELILVIFSRRRIPNSIAFVVTLIVMTAAALAARRRRPAGRRRTRAAARARGVAIVLAGLGAPAAAARREATGATAPTRASRRSSGDLRHGAGRRRVPGLRRGVRQPQEPRPPPGRRSDDRRCGLRLEAPDRRGLRRARHGALHAGRGLRAARRRARPTRSLDRARAWLVAHNRLIMGVICTLLGLVLVVKGAGRAVNHHSHRSARSARRSRPTRSPTPASLRLRTLATWAYIHLLPGFLFVRQRSEFIQGWRGGRAGRRVARRGRLRRRRRRRRRTGARARG